MTGTHGKILILESTWNLTNMSWELLIAICLPENS